MCEIRRKARRMTENTTVAPLNQKAEDVKEEDSATDINNKFEEHATNDEEYSAGSSSSDPSVAVCNHIWAEHAASERTAEWFLWEWRKSEMIRGIPAVGLQKQ